MVMRGRLLILRAGMNWEILHRTLLALIFCSLTWTLPGPVSAEAASSKDLEMLSPEMGRAEAGITPPAVPSVKDEGITGTSINAVNEATDEDDEEEEDGSDAGTGKIDIVCTTTITHTTSDGGIRVSEDRSSALVLEGSLGMKEALERAMKVAEADVIKETVSKVVCECAFSQQD